jgi:ABC-type arginine transport system permease subunit
MIVISIVDFLGFNGFIRVSKEFANEDKAGGAFGIVISIIYLCLAIGSSYLYFRIFRERSILTKALL